MAEFNATSQELEAFVVSIYVLGVCHPPHCLLESLEEVG